MIIAAFVGAAAIGVGIYFGWAIKGLWYNYDIAGTLKNQDFDYFKWTDRADQEAIFLADVSQVLAVSFWARVKLSPYCKVQAFEQKEITKTTVRGQTAIDVMSFTWNSCDNQPFQTKTCTNFRPNYLLNSFSTLNFVN